MVGFTLSGHRIGTVAIFATLFVAIQVKGEKGCVFDVDHENVASEFDLECNGLKNSWTVEEVEKESNSNNKKAFVLNPEEEGCLKTKNSVILNSTTRIAVRFSRENSEDENGFFTLRLVPTEGSCSDEECVWTPKTIPKQVSGKWITLENQFPLKAQKEFNIQVEVKKRKDKFELDSISVPELSGSSKCVRSDRSTSAKPGSGLTEGGQKGTVVFADRYVGQAVNLTDESTTGGTVVTTAKSTAPGLIEISKNLMLTSASVLTLNHFLN